MLAAERRNQIYEKLQKEKKVVVSELSRFYQVTEETIRRDLEKLEKDGLAIKSYGGAILNEDTNIDLPFNIRKKHNATGKQKIAELVAGLVSSGEHVMLDPSSTSVFIAKALKKKGALTVVTNSVEIMLELSDTKDWTIISTGGRLNQSALAFAGAKAMESIEAYHVEKVIISCKAFEKECGFMDSDEEFVQMKRAMLKAGRERILAVDSSKIGKMAFGKVGTLEDIDMIVTDHRPDEEILRVCEAAHVTCIYPEEKEGSCEKLLSGD